MYQTQYYRPRFAFGLTDAVKVLIGANFVFFLMQLLFPANIIQYLILVPEMAFKKLYLWQFVTYMFLHGGFFHIFFNMFALWMFGSAMENTWGTRKFLQYYFVTGIGAGIVWAIFNSSPTIGASGAIYGLLLAYGITYPDRYVYLYFMIPLKAKYFVIIFGALEFISSFGARDGIAHLAHLSGMVIGFIYLKLIPFIRKPRSSGTKYKIFDRSKTKYPPRNLNKEVDEILDKILLFGEDSLTKEEREILERVSREYDENRQD
ncbi:rhomboid family intramembrane serine protease [bacterium]|nr:rhomboid family intramembrane serine protease [bacterium]